MYRIEIVEDDVMIQQVLRETLKPEGFEVFCCGTGEEALKIAGADRPDLVILDVNLPDLNGFEICRRLKADPRTKHIPVLMMTGEARDVVQKVEGLDSGAEDYLFKPVGSKVLLARVKSLLKIAGRPT